MDRVVTDHTAACERPVRDCSFLSRARKPSRDSSRRPMSGPEEPSTGTARSASPGLACRYEVCASNWNGLTRSCWLRTGRPHRWGIHGTPAGD